VSPCFQPRRRAVTQAGAGYPIEPQKQHIAANNTELFTRHSRVENITWRRLDAKR
jgi:hypothetical protein